MIEPVERVVHAGNAAKAPIEELLGEAARSGKGIHRRSHLDVRAQHVDRLLHAPARGQAGDLPRGDLAAQLPCQALQRQRLRVLRVDESAVQIEEDGDVQSRIAEHVRISDYLCEFHELRRADTLDESLVLRPELSRRIPRINNM